MKLLLVKLIGSYFNVLSYFSKSFAANKALLLFSTPRKGKITKRHKPFLDTATKEQLKYEAYAIMTYKWGGSKKTILLVHGWESNSARWKRLIISLKAKNYNIIALDAPAHGESGSAVFNALLYAEFINVVAKKHHPEIIIGHSVGGMASVFFQHKYHFQNIKKIVLLGAPSEFVGVFNRYTTMMRYNQKVTQHLNAMIVERFGGTPDSFSTAKYLEAIDSHGLIIHDKEDQIIPYDDALLIKNSFKNSKLITTKGFGHSLNNNTVINYIDEFIGLEVN